jgi:hypothetical protein
MLFLESNVFEIVVNFLLRNEFQNIKTRLEFEDSNVINIVQMSYIVQMS